jgi:hypothetical protein
LLFSPEQTSVCREKYRHDVAFVSSLGGELGV